MMIKKKRASRLLIWDRRIIERAQHEPLLVEERGIRRRGGHAEPGPEATSCLNTKRTMLPSSSSSSPLPRRLAVCDQSSGGCCSRLACVRDLVVLLRLVEWPSSASPAWARGASQREEKMGYLSSLGFACVMDDSHTSNMLGLKGGC